MYINVKIICHISERITDHFNLYRLSTFVTTMYYFYTYRIVIF